MSVWECPAVRLVICTARGSTYALQVLSHHFSSSLEGSPLLGTEGQWKFCHRDDHLIRPDGIISLRIPSAAPVVGA